MFILDFALFGVFVWTNRSESWKHREFEWGGGKEAMMEGLKSTL